MITAFIKIFIIIYMVVGISLVPTNVQSALAAEALTAEKTKQRMTVTITPVDPVAASRAYRVVLLCDTQDLRTQGLQGFRPLAKDEAAFFVFEKSEAVTFWMGSVAYPIDIIFVGRDKKVIKVYRNCKPGSPNLYPSIKQAKWVIETAAGSGIKVGDRVGMK